MDWEVPKIQLRSYDDVAAEVHSFDDLKIAPRKVTAAARGIKRGSDDPGYECSDLRSWRWMDAGSVMIPGFGLLDLNGKAKQQLSTFFKVKWPEAFRYMPTSDMASYLRAYLKHLPEEERTVVKVIAREYIEDDIKTTATAEGILRGVVSPGYYSISDSRIMDRMQASVGASLKDMSFAQRKQTDSGSHSMIVFNEPIELAGQEALNIGDSAYFGCRMRNSDVGTYAFSMVLWLIRWMCSNGMISGEEGETLLYRQHRSIDNEELDGLITEAFDEMPRRRDEVVEQTRLLHAIKIEDPIRELRGFLRGHPKHLKDAAEEAYSREPVSTAFGVLQALTRVSMASREDADRQYDLERLAGTYVGHALKAA